MDILFIQNRPSKAGAQHSLKRIVTHEAFKNHNIVIITSKEGWLTSELKGYKNIDILIKEFPSSRSLKARVFQNRFWAKEIAKRLKSRGFYPDIIHANEYIENILTLELSKYFKKSKTALFLRSALMKKEDFYKYRCDRNSIKIAVSDILKKDIVSYYNKNIYVVYDFLYESEFFKPKTKPINFPKKILIIGNPHPNKGWDIAIEALKIFEKRYPFAIEEVHFTGELKDIKLKHIQPIFHKKFQNLSYAAREFDFVISPSKYESFGLANLEVLASGVILLSSKRGVVKDILDSDFLFEPDSKELYKKLENIYINWRKINIDLDKIQKKIKSRYLEDNAKRVLDIYKRVIS